MANEKNNKKKKGMIIGFTVLGAGAVATAVAVPLILTSKKDNTPVVPPITGTYYSILNDNNRFNTYEEAANYLLTKLTKPQVYKYKGVEYSSYDKVEHAILQAEQDFLADQTNINKIVQKSYSFTGTGFEHDNVDKQPISGISVAGWQEQTGTKTGYIFDNKVYPDLEKAQTAWLTGLTSNVKVPAVAGQPAINGSAEVITTNPYFSGKFDIVLDQPTPPTVQEIISDITWTENTPTIIAAEDSLETISFADTGTTLHFSDGTQQSSFLVDYSASPIALTSDMLVQKTPYRQASSTFNQLSVTAFMTTTAPILPGYQYQFEANDQRFVGKTFPHMDGTVFSQGDCSNADLAIFFDKLVKGIGIKAINVIDSPQALEFVMADNVRKVKVPMSGVTKPTTWKDINYMNNTQDTPASRDSKAAAVYALVKGGFLNLNNQATVTTTPATPATYTLTVPYTHTGSTETAKVFDDIQGPIDGSPLTIGDFHSTITGGAAAETHYSYTLNYKSNPTTPPIIATMGQVHSEPQLTADHIAINVESNYVPEVVAVAEVLYTIADAPAIETNSYNNTSIISDTGTPVGDPTLHEDTGTFNGYVYNNIFYLTYFEAQQAMLAAEMPRTEILPSDTAQPTVIYNGSLFADLAAAKASLIYHVDWIGSPNTPVVHSRNFEDLYELI